MTIQPTDRGPVVNATGFQHGKLVHVPGEHLWIAMAMYRVDPTKKEHFLDTENLLTIEGPGCYWCEQQWKPGAEKTRCTGGPECQS